MKDYFARLKQDFDEAGPINTIFLIGFIIFTIVFGVWGYIYT